MSNYDLMSVEDAMIEAGFKRTNDPSFPWQGPDGNGFSEQGAKDYFAAMIAPGSKVKPQKMTEPSHPSEAAPLDNEPNSTSETVYAEDETKLSSDQPEDQIDTHNESEQPKESNEPREASDLEPIFKARMFVREKEQAMEQAKKKAKNAKAAFEDAQQHLLSVIDKVHSDNEPTLFDGIPEKRVGLTDVVYGEIPDSDEGWKATPLDQVFAGMTSTIMDGLAELELKTMGDLQAWLENKKLTDLPGVGEAKAEKLEQRMEEFWERYSQTTTTEPDDEESEDEDDDI